MISLEQILLLQDRVENAVAKIAQLNAENVALRRKCAELTNALAAKTEQFSSFQNDQNKIEEGILKALNRLDALENTVLSASGSVIAQKNQENNSESKKSEENNNGTENHSDNSVEVEEKISSENTAETVPESAASNENEVQNPVSNEAESQKLNSNEPELNLAEQNENQIPADVPSESVNVEKSENTGNSENSAVQNEVQTSGNSENPENIVQTQNQENIPETVNPNMAVSENNSAQKISENVQVSVAESENLENIGNPEKTQGDSSSQALFDIF